MALLAILDQIFFPHSSANKNAAGVLSSSGVLLSDKRSPPEIARRSSMPGAVSRASVRATPSAVMAAVLIATRTTAADSIHRAIATACITDALATWTETTPAKGCRRRERCRCRCRTAVWPATTTTWICPISPSRKASTCTLRDVDRAFCSQLLRCPLWRQLCSRDL